MTSLRYTQGTASVQELRTHLLECNPHFVPPLQDKVDLRDYAQKIFEHAVTFEAWSDDVLVGMVAAYFNDLDERAGFITNVSTLKRYMGQGIASKLIHSAIEHARQHDFVAILLEVEKANEHAIELYEKIRFHRVEDRDSAILMKIEV